MPARMYLRTRSRCWAEASGPSRVSGARGSPGLNFAAARFAISSACSWRLRGTSMRVHAEQVWPAFKKALETETPTALSKSASSRMTLADLPPSSSATRLIVPAASSATRRPAAVDPVSEIMSTRGWRTRASPNGGPRPVTRLNTPGGSPASCTTSARMNAVSGATSLGLSTTVQPAASAGATLPIAWCSG